LKEEGKRTKGKMEFTAKLNLLSFSLAAEFCLIFLGAVIFFLFRSRRYRTRYLQAMQYGGSFSSLAGTRKAMNPESPPAKTQASETRQGREELPGKEAKK
jgi:hypothetical protein